MFSVESWRKAVNTKADFPLTTYHVLFLERSLKIILMGAAFSTIVKNPPNKDKKQVQIFIYNLIKNGEK